MFSRLLVSAEEVNDHLDPSLEAMDYGSHHMVVWLNGLDRFVMLLAGEENIRKWLPS